MPGGFHEVGSLHPASLILLAVSFLLAGGSRDGRMLLLVCAAAALAALLLARPQYVLILRRSRWLILTMLILFGWMTPGTPVAWLPGATLEGLWLAAESLARLLIAIATVAGLLTALTPASLVAGLRGLLAPLALFGDFRDRLSVRLMLTLEEIESQGRAALVEPLEPLSLRRRMPGPGDVFMWMASSVLVAIACLA